MTCEVILELFEPLHEGVLDRLWKVLQHVHVDFTWVDRYRLWDALEMKFGGVYIPIVDVVGGHCGSSLFGWLVDDVVGGA